MRVLIYVHGERAEFEWINNWTTFVINLTKHAELECSLRFSKDIFITEDVISDVDMVFLIKNNVIFDVDIFKKMVLGLKDDVFVSSLRIGNTMDSICGIKDKDDDKFISRNNIEFLIKENKENEIKNIKVYKSHYDFTIIKTETIQHVLNKPFHQWDDILEAANVTKYIDTSIYTPIYTNIVI